MKREFAQYMLFSIVIALSCCKTKSKNERSVSSYSRIEIYCWCVLNDPAINTPDQRLCTSLAAIQPVSLIKSEYRFYSTSDTAIISALTQLVFSGKERSEVLSQKLDSRFLILFRRSNSDADTLYSDFYRFNRFGYNDKNLYNYSFNVVDSIRSILHKKVIDCGD